MADMSRGSYWRFVDAKRLVGVHATKCVVCSSSPSRSATPHPDTTTDILIRAFALVPELAPPSVLNPTVDDLRPLIIDIGCGHRPAREGGIRLEVEWVTSDSQGKKVPVVFNYGYVCDK